MFARHRLARSGLAFVLAALPLSAVFAAEPSNVCNFYGYTADPDPAGTNVRGGPGTDNPILVVLPQSVGPDGFTPEFHITGFADGWFEIEDVAAGQYGDAPEEKLFRGPGWISARLVSFDIEDMALRAGPSMDAAATTDLMADAWFSNGVYVETVHACQGSFIDVTVTNKAGQTARGWAGDLCGNQATTCS